MRLLWYCAAGGTGALAAAMLILLASAANRSPPPIAAPIPVPVVAKPDLSTIKEQRRKEGMTARPVEQPPATKEDLVRALGGEEIVAFLQNPDWVEAVLLETPARPQTTPPDEYVPSTPDIRVDEEVAAHLVGILLEPGPHRLWPKGVVKGCYPVFGLRFRFYSNFDRVDLYVCLQCQHLIVYHGDQVIPFGGVEFNLELLLPDAVNVFPDEPSLRPLAAAPSEFYGIRPIVPKRDP
jgi:hypothetical protein